MVKDSLTIFLKSIIRTKIINEIIKEIKYSYIFSLIYNELMSLILIEVSYHIEVNFSLYF